MVADPLGKAGSHPDVRELLAVSLSENFRKAGIPATPSREQLEVLQQRTFLDRQHPNRRIGGVVAITSCLAVLRSGAKLPSGARLDDHLILFEALRPATTSGWEVVGVTGKGLGDPPLLPFVGALMVTRNGLSCGAYVSDPRVATQRVEFADGTIVEDGVENRSLHLFIPFSSPAAWARDAVVRLLDSSGAEVVAQQVYMKPEAPPGISPRRKSP